MHYKIVGDKVRCAWYGQIVDLLVAGRSNGLYFIPMEVAQRQILHVEGRICCGDGRNCGADQWSLCATPVDGNACWARHCLERRISCQQSNMLPEQGARWNDV